MNYFLIDVQTRGIVHSNFDKNPYPTGIKISDEDIEKVNIQRNEFHEEWNYTILPGSSKLQ